MAIPLDLERPTSYRAPINLYVEDRITRAYLKELWNDRAIAYFLGRSNEGVAAIVRIDEEAEHPNVFGIIDRDYGLSNQDRWNNPGTRLFRLAVHEVENHLLITPALASSRSVNKRLGIERIEELAIEAARGRCWYEACRIVLGTIRRRFRDDFIIDPPQNLPNLEAAKRHLCESDWFRGLASHAAQTSENSIGEMLEAEHIRTCARLDDGSWRQHFSGKEIFRDLVSHIRDHQGTLGITPRQVEIDIAEDVATWQLDQGQISSELVLLHQTLRRRVGLT